MGFDAWDYRGLDVDDAEVATTTKTWAGWTERDSPRRTTTSSRWSPRWDNAAVVATALAIDVALEQGTQTRGSTLSGTPDTAETR